MGTNLAFASKDWANHKKVSPQVRIWTRAILYMKQQFYAIYHDVHVLVSNCHELDSSLWAKLYSVHRNCKSM